jgi:uncharacterized protein YbaR (Trm112 family)
MKEDLLEVLCCPVCKGDLVLRATKRSKDEILEGTLTCKKCSEAYPIEDSIPNLLPADERTELKQKPAKGGAAHAR